MKHTISSGNNEQGFVLVLALFMLTICTMIGMAAMSTSTTELDIAGNERVHKETFYQAEAVSAAVAEAMLSKDAYGTWSNGEKFANLGLNGYIQINDGAFLMEEKDVNPEHGDAWKKDYQNDTVEAAPDVSIRLTNQFNADVDVDKVAVRHISGSGSEFGSGAEGAGVSSHKVIYNMDCIGTLPSRNLRLADNTLNPNVPLSEIFLGYRYVPQ
ncbi:MAG: pilus assembly PilX N-terminal domain-containing protein [Proteobacteria bacterium]|nr:pilus assembly PilX N-terminal domain-containing protein [Pseudomonadota bacterium]